MILLAPPVRMQQSSLANVKFALKRFIYPKLPANLFLGRYQCTVQIWTCLNHPKCPFLNSKKSNLAHFKLRGIFFLFRNEAAQ